MRKCSLCLVSETEVAPFLDELRKKHPQASITLISAPGTVEILFQGGHLDHLVQAVREKFPTFFYEAESIEEAMHREFIARNKTLALAESCTGGAVAAKIVSIPDASKYFLGSIVAYSNGWKERFLQVSRTTIQQKGVVSSAVATEMVAGLFHETDADFGAAITGLAGSAGAPIYIAIGKRGEKIDAGSIPASSDRNKAIDLTVHLVLGALWRRLVHNTATFS